MSRYRSMIILISFVKKTFIPFINLIPVIFMFFFISCNYGQQKTDLSMNESENNLQTRKSDWWKWKAEQMVNSQIIARGITDERVIRVMKNTPRHLFIPDIFVPEAYDDGPLPIGEGQTISQPYIVAIMTELLELKGTERVLEIGTGSGYQAAILSMLVDTCYTIEIVRVLADSSRNRLKRLGYNNVVVKWGDGYKGWPEHAPFDGIIITAAPEKIPEKLLDQLKIGGRMVVPVGTYIQELTLIIKERKGYIKKDIIPVRFVPMIKSE